MTVAVGFCSGAHVHTELLIELFRAHDGATIVGLATDNRERDSGLTERHGITVRSPDRLFELADAVCVCSTTATHDRWVRAAADAGVAVLCEKPLATKMETARSLLAACTEAGVQLGMVMPLPFSEPARRAKQIYDDGRLGTPQLLVGTNRAKLRNRHETGWSADPDAAGGGAVMDHTVHIVDLVRWLTGREIVSVHAELATMHDALDVEDVNVLSMALDDGTPFSLDGSWDRPSNWEYWGDATLTICSTDGELTVDCYGETIRETQATGDQQGSVLRYAGAEPMAGVVDDFINAVASARPPLIDGHDGVRALAVCVGAYESARTGAPVSIPVAER